MLYLNPPDPVTVSENWQIRYWPNFFDNNGAKSFKNVNNCLNAIFYFYLETSGGQSSNLVLLYLNMVHFINASVN